MSRPSIHAPLEEAAAGLAIAAVVGLAVGRRADLERIAEGGGSLVLYRKGGGRVTAPSFEFWMGREKSALLALLAGKLDEHAIAFSGNSLKAMVHVGDR